MLGWSHSIYIQNLSSIGPMVNEIQYNGDLTFDLNLHNQDGLISTWPYYVICLSGHTPYAYKIWAQLDQWFSSYKTKGNVCVGVCACVCDIGIRKWVNWVVCFDTIKIKSWYWYFKCCLGGQNDPWRWWNWCTCYIYEIAVTVYLLWRH